MEISLSRMLFVKKIMSNIQTCSNKLRQLRCYRARSSRRSSRRSELSSAQNVDFEAANLEGAQALSNKNPPIKPTDEKVEDLEKYLEFPSDAHKYWMKLKESKLRNEKRDQSQKAFRPRIDPRETTIFLFPGQGSQFVGMGRNLLKYPKVEEMYKHASKILGFNLLEMCLNGPKEELDKTLHCQPAVVVTSLAAIEKLKEEKPWAIESCITTAGYSVGEISALAFAGALSFEDAIHLVKARSEAMQKASELQAGGMMTVFISPNTKLKFACSAARLFCKQELHINDPVCEITNFLHPGCKVIAGNSEALEFIARNAKEFGIKRVSRLPVSGAFHSLLMKPAAKSIEKVVSSLNIEELAVPVHSNVTSHCFHSPDEIRNSIIQQIYRPVMWEQIMHSVYTRPKSEHFPKTFEVGPGKQLGAMLKQVNVRAFEEYEAVEV